MWHPSDGRRRQLKAPFSGHRAQRDRYGGAPSLPVHYAPRYIGLFWYARPGVRSGVNSFVFPDRRSRNIPNFHALLFSNILLGRKC